MVFGNRSKTVMFSLHHCARQTEVHLIIEISVVTPYRYTRILFLMAIGMTLFGERPGILVLCGAGLVVLSGFRL